MFDKSLCKTSVSNTHKFSVAPMMDWTDRHCRVFHRLMTRRARLYTEMLTTGAIIHGDRRRLLGFDASEHPVALQLGGSDPRDLATSAKIGEDFGYDEINLNVGCPSDRVKDGRFGACLMAEPALVAACVDAMKRTVGIPVTVKCRIGIDDQDPEAALDALARGLSGAVGIRDGRTGTVGRGGASRHDERPVGGDDALHRARTCARRPPAFYHAAFRRRVIECRRTPCASSRSM